MFRGMKILLCATLMFALITSACGGDDDDDGDDNTPAASETSSATEPAGEDETPSSGSTPSSGGSGIDIESTPPAESDRVWTLEEAEALLATLPITPDDLESNWTIMADTTTDNAAAAAAPTADPDAAALNERCGRLLSRLVVNSPDQADLVARYIGGETVSVFSTFTVYATDAGAADCAAESVARLTAGGCPAIARLFGSVFINPDAVSCVPFEFPQIGNGSNAIGLTGQINAAGMVVGLTIRVVSWRYGNITAVVGTAAATDPLIAEFEPLVETVLPRLEATR